MRTNPFVKKTGWPAEQLPSDVHYYNPNLFIQLKCDRIIRAVVAVANETENLVRG